jgi:endonuclease/exonuclease/phosphatase family metal-dependent hydrolase
MIKPGFSLLCRLALPLVFGVFLAMGISWDNLQLESFFGQAAATELRGTPSAYWGDDPAPTILAERADLPPLRAVIYNLHSGLGPDWRLFAPRADVEANLRAVARHLAAAAPAESPVDVVGLNEVDFHSRRSGWIDQAEFLADELRTLTGSRYQVVRGETWRRDVPGLEVRFGNALLVRHPVVDLHACTLGGSCEEESRAVLNPAGGLLSRRLGEKRGVVRVRIDFHNHPVDVLVTHLEAFVLKQREGQAAEILRGYMRPDISTVLLGDTNAVPSAMTAARHPFAADRTHDILTSGKLIDARIDLAARSGADDLSPWATYPAGAPQWPLDGIFATADMSPQTVQVVGGEESDHRGLLVNYGWLGNQSAKEHGLWHDTMRRRQLEQILARDFRTMEPGITRRADWLATATGYGEMAVELLRGSNAL